ncbi:Peroxiredoxin [Abditibacterium utsteinense]|uniref:Peroxiredoxin n=1 Tax=Abditibacterium utsteinense TaxID=1960156 RepID=A0A2S8SUH8_9BACT|nr:TlpA disulfide reductase family protein [Abditibacterium utsteinense]PQV64409.1 Peroxiredoxin [Abditibacterium utsteinense]
MKSPHLSLLIAALFVAVTAPASSWAQTESRVLPAREEATIPQIEPEAQTAIEALVARYAALRSYADTTQLKWEDEAGAAIRPDDGLNFTATLQWQRPHNIRFEGTNRKGAFLAFGDALKLRVISPNYPGNYVSRVRNPLQVLINEDGTRTTLPADDARVQFDAPLMEVEAGAPGYGFLLEPNFWTRTQKEASVLALEPDAEADGELCRVVRMQLDYDEGATATIRLFIAKSDGLLRRLEQRDERMGARARIVETHSDVRVNPNLPDSTWDFQAPADAKPIEYFSQLNPHQFDPALKIGDLLPTFSADDIKGEPLELNSKSGKVTAVYFSNMAQAIIDVQILKKMDKVIGRDKLQIVFVSGDGARQRVAKFVEHLKLPFSTYFDESGMRNPLAQKFGVKGWATTFIFASDGKLETICSHPSEVSFNKSIKKLLPDTPDDAFILQDGEFISAP